MEIKFTNMLINPVHFVCLNKKECKFRFVAESVEMEFPKDNVGHDVVKGEFILDQGNLYSLYKTLKAFFEENEMILWLAEKIV